MRFHLLSDLHLEISAFDIDKVPGCNALILAGDIGDPSSSEYQALLKKASTLYLYVFIISGNHEVYSNTLEDTHKYIQTLCAEYDNVIFLNRSVFDIDPDIRIIGTTLWSDIADDERSEIQMSIADFQYIQDWSIEKCKYQHHLDVKFIKKEIQKASEENKRLVVITHHAPMKGSSHPKHAGSTISSAFSTDLKELIKPPVVAWIFGHVHYSCECMTNGVKLLSNQKGHDGENSNFNPFFTFEI